MVCLIYFMLVNSLLVLVKLFLGIRIDLNVKLNCDFIKKDFLGEILSLNYLV